MIIEQKLYINKGWEQISKTPAEPGIFDLVLAFGSTSLLKDPSIYQQIREFYPKADILVNSTAGEIADIYVQDDSVSVTAIHFDKSHIHTAVTNIFLSSDSFEAGRILAEALAGDNLKSVLVISDGQHVNGSDLVKGLQQHLPENTILTGGLAGDGSQFSTTLVGLNAAPQEGNIAAVGFYGENLLVTCGSMGGWDPFGHERLVTRSKGNILYELDGKAALDIYKLYLGEYASELPGSGLLFPLSIRIPGNGNHPVVRTILAVNEAEKSLTFAGDIPQGAYARLMKASLDRLIEGASHAAQNTIGKIQSPGLAILISCVGRKLVLGQRIEEEIEAVRAAYGDKTVITGFYSYGEICPSGDFLKCELHNQTMTITTMTEL